MQDAIAQRIAPLRGHWGTHPVQHLSKGHKLSTPHSVLPAQAGNHNLKSRKFGAEYEVHFQIN